MKTLGAPKDTGKVKKQSGGNERAEEIKRAQKEAVSSYFLNQQIHTCWRASPAPLSSCCVTEDVSYSCITHLREWSWSTFFAEQPCSTITNRNNMMFRNLGSPRQAQNYSRWLINQYILVALGFIEDFLLHTHLHKSPQIWIETVFNSKSFSSIFGRHPFQIC